MSLTEHTLAGRIAAVVMLAVLAAALWLGPISAYLDLIGSGAEQLEQQAALLQRYRALVRQPATETGRTDLGALSVMLPDGGEGQAIAQLQERLKTAATTNRVQVQSLQVLRNEALASAVRIGVRIHAAGDLASLVRLLYAIETAHPVLYPDNLQIQLRAPVAGAAAEAIDFRLDVSAFQPGPAS